jgi:hypothetical protein
LTQSSCRIKQDIRRQKEKDKRQKEGGNRILIKSGFRLTFTFYLFPFALIFLAGG